MVAGTAPAARDLGLDGARGLEVRGMRHAVGDDRRFERDERPAGGAGLGDLGREGERRRHGTSQAMWRAAAARAARSAASASRPSARAARWAATKASPAPVSAARWRPAGGARVTVPAAVGGGRRRGAVGDDRLGGAAATERRGGGAAVGEGGAADRLGLAAVQVERQRPERRAAAPARPPCAGSPAPAPARAAVAGCASERGERRGREVAVGDDLAGPGDASRPSSSGASSAVPARSSPAQSATAAWSSPARGLDREIGVGRGRRGGGGRRPSTPAVGEVSAARSSPAASRPIAASSATGRCSAASASATLSATPPGRRTIAAGHVGAGRQRRRGAADHVPVRRADAEDGQPAGIRRRARTGA